MTTASRDGFRRWGYLQADIDPLGRIPPFEHPELEGAGEEGERWRAIYCGAIGAEFMHIPWVERSRWVAARMEGPSPAPDRARLLARIALAEQFERFLHARYVGTKRYSLEGTAALVPLLDAILEAAAARGADTVLLGMSHRGRLNVLAHVVGVPYDKILAGFEDVDPRSMLGGGDVKYHLGATGTYETPTGRRLEVHLASNPSHLEAVGPVLLGRCRAHQDRRGEGGTRAVLPVLLHGDGAFAGQGITAETLNLAGLPGFAVGGTIHVIVNNLIGFTEAPEALHSSRYASDLARRLPIPILHVNGEQPEAVVRVGAMALEYRMDFASDVVVDLVGYRRYGHSEVEDPTTTQPLVYRQIAERPRLSEAYAALLPGGPAELGRIGAELQARLDQAQEQARATEERPVLREMPQWWRPFHGGRYDPADEVATAVPAERIAEVAQAVTTTPGGFHLHPKVATLLEHRREMAEGRRPVDWGMAETLALGTLLAEGIPVRLAGEDSRRGTFNQRHAALVDVEDGRLHLPLASLGRAQVLDTALSEAAALGFEYGYSRDFPEALVCWEAQFGDFANGAQVIIDQFLVAGETKWDLLSGLVLLLPHGYEGQGAEHSSARLERFLDLTADDAIQVAQPSTAAQYFHLLRRQALLRWRKPLVVLTPKGLLRAAAASSPVAELATGRFEPVLLEPELTAAERVLVCTGKIAHELRAERARRGDTRTAVVALERLWPFPEAELEGAFDWRDPAREVVWVQEEPANMGALRHVLPRLEALGGGRPLRSVKRSASPSPATGSARAHAIEQATLVDLAFRRFD